MIPAMAGPPEEPGTRGAERIDLDPEDAPLELDEEGFLVSGGRRRQFPTDLDAWVRWAGALVVAAAAFETLAFLISGSLSGWATGAFDVPLPRPDGYYSLLLLAGVLLLILRRRSGTSEDGPGWVRGAACLAAGTGGALVVAQVSGNIGAIVQRSGLEFGQPAAYVAGNVVSGIGGFADAVIAAFAATLAVLLYRWSRIAAGVGTEDTGEIEPEGGIEESGTSTEPDRGPWGSVGPPVASLLLGAAVAGACLVALAVGTRNQINDYLGLPPTTASPAVTVPSPNTSIACSSNNSLCVTYLGPGNLINLSGTPGPGTAYEPTWKCTTTPGSGVTLCSSIVPPEPISPSPSS